MTMQMLSVDLWNSYLQPYLADLGVAVVFGIGYYVFKSLHRDKRKTDSSVKENKEIKINKWSRATTIQKFNALIISNNDKSDDAFKILNAMQRASLNPDVVTYNCLLDMSYKLEQLEQAKKLFEEISDFTSPVQPDIVTFNIVLKGSVAELRSLNISPNSSKNNEILLAKKEQLSKILGILRDIKNRGLKMNVITFNTSIDACIEAGDLDYAWELYSEMKQCELSKPDIYTYATLIKGLKSNNIHNESNIDKAIEILNLVNSGECENLKADEVLYNSVLDTCIKYQKIEVAEKLFKDMKIQGVAPTLVTYSIMIKGYGMIFKLDKAINMFNEMKLENIIPNEIIYGCLLNCAVRSNRIDTMSEVYESLKADKVKPNHIIYTTLIKGYNKAKDYNKAFEIFDSISEREKKTYNIVIFNAILDCCVESKNFEKLNTIYEFIKKQSEECETFPQPNVITYSTVIKGYAKCGKISQAKTIYQFLKDNAFQLDEVLFNTVCDGFARANQCDMALSILQDMKNNGIKRSSIVYSILIKMYSNQLNEEKCLEVFREMLKDNVKPSLVSYTTLIQMYIKVKKIQKAVEMFEEMKKNGIKPDQVTYNFMVNGCTFNQKLEKAIEYLLESIQDNIKLSEETYNNCLGYLLNNKFMKHNDRVEYGSKILKQLKDKNFNIDYEVYSKVLRLIYKNNDNNKSIESKLSNFKSYPKKNYNGFDLEEDNNNNNGNLNKQKKRAYK